MTKRLLCVFLTVLMTVGIFPLVTTKSSAAACYDSEAALEYAEDNWDSGVGLCADFAAACLRAGGVDVPGGRVITLYNDIVSNNYGKIYKLKLTNGKSGSVKLSANEGKVDAGDLVFYYCNVCKNFDHVVVCNGANSEGYLQDYAHNNAHNGRKRTYTYRGSCGYDNWTLYSAKLHSSDTLFGEKTSIKAPKISSITNAGAGVNLKWDKIDNATFYRVYRKVPGGSWKFLERVKATAYTDTTAENGQEYIYTVRAGKGKVLSQYYLGESITVLTLVDFTSIKNNLKTVTLTWNKNVEGDGYYVYRNVNNTGWCRYYKIANKNATKFIDKNVTEGNTYHYRIRAYDDSCFGAYDPKGLSVTILGTPVIKSAANTVKGVLFSWNASEGAKEYRVYRKADNAKNWSYIATVSETSYVDTAVESGVTYTYTVRAKLGTALSGYDKKGATTLYLKTPTLVSAQALNEGVSLVWENVDGASRYFVYRKANGEKSWTRIAVVNGTNEYTDGNVKEGTEYTYTVRAYYGKAKSSFYSAGIDCKYVLDVTTASSQRIFNNMAKAIA